MCSASGFLSLRQSAYSGEPEQSGKADLPDHADIPARYGPIGASGKWWRVAASSGISSVTARAAIFSRPSSGDPAKARATVNDLLRASNLPFHAEGDAATACLHVPASQVRAFAAAMSEANVIAYKEAHR